MQNPEFKLHPSRLYALFLGVMLFGSAVIILMLPFSVWLRALMLAVLLVYGASVVWRHVLLRAENSITSVNKLADQRWQLITRAGVIDASLRGDSTVTTFVSVLRFDAVQGKRMLPCIIFRDSLPADDYRRLISCIRAG